MLSKRLLDAMNEQIKNEMYSAYLYLAMGAYAESVALRGVAHWMENQAQEELEHAMKFYGYIHERGGRVELMALEKPPVEFAGPTDLFQQTLTHEKFVTSKINDLYTIAVEDKDYASQSFLDWFVNEQVEEEATATEILDILKMVGEKGHSLFMLDRQLGQR